MRCPLCRYAVDRYDLRHMGYPVSPRALARVADACAAFRSLLSNHFPPGGADPHVPRSTHLTRVVMRCATLTARDGFLYNTCVLALERMLHHKMQFASSLRVQLASSHRAALPRDRSEFIASSLACHVDVLMHTANVVDTAGEGFP
jgi:hypothetical protein